MKKDFIKLDEIIDIKATKINRNKYHRIMNFLIILNKVTFGIFEKKLRKYPMHLKHLINPVMR
jgi:hypothetical protein